MRQDIYGGCDNSQFPLCPFCQTPDLCMLVTTTDSMAEGVEKAAVIICFMNANYQNSENCQLELKFAKQSGLPIVPVMVADDPKWKASGWLGIVTAGSL